MSVSKEVYVIYGQELDYKTISKHYQTLDDQNLIFSIYNQSPINTCGILFDGMSGNYCVAGICLGIDSDNNFLNITLDKIYNYKYFTHVDDFFITHIDNTYAPYKREFKLFIISHCH